jgi:hypothetical protein
MGSRRREANLRADRQEPPKRSASCSWSRSSLPSPRAAPVNRGPAGRLRSTQQVKQTRSGFTGARSTTSIKYVPHGMSYEQVRARLRVGRRLWSRCRSSRSSSRESFSSPSMRCLGGTAVLQGRLRGGDPLTGHRRARGALLGGADSRCSEGPVHHVGRPFNLGAAGAVHGGRIFENRRPFLGMIFRLHDSGARIVRQRIGLGVLLPSEQPHHRDSCLLALVGILFIGVIHHVCFRAPQALE